MKLFIFNSILVYIFTGIISPDNAYITDYLLMLSLFSGVVILFEFVILISYREIVKTIKS